MTARDSDCARSSRRAAARRVLLALASLWLVTLASFGLSELLPGNQGDADGARGAFDPAVMAARRARLDLDRPRFWNPSPRGGVLGSLSETRYAGFVGRLVRLDLGISERDGRPVTEKLGRALGPTLLLGSAALALAFGLGVPLGLLSARREGGALDHAIGLGLFLLAAVPSFWAATLALVFLAGPGAFPMQGLVSAGAAELGPVGRALDLLWHLVLPVTCLGYGILVVVARQMRAAAAAALASDWFRTLRAQGLSRRRLTVRLLRNALLPVVTLLGLELPILVSGSVIVERVFGIPGLGLLLAEAVLQRDQPVLLALVTLSALVTWVGLLCADVLSGLADPRTRLEDPS